MKDVETFKGTLTVVKRLNNSYLGNPRFRLMIGDIVADTMPDYAYNYDVDNWRDKPVVARIGWHRGKLQVASLEADDD